MLSRLAPPLLAVAAAVAWFAWTATEPPEVGRQLFGKWGTRSFAIGIGLVWLALALACRAASRRALLRWLLATVMLATTWLLLEVAAVLGVVSYRSVFGFRPPVILGAAPVPNADIRGVTYPDLAELWGLPCEPIEFRYKTDRRGFRNEHDRAAADVYTLADSFLVAGMLPWPEILPARLEARLGRPVMNLSLIGLGPQTQHAVLRDAGVPLEGRVVLQFVFEGNDLVDSADHRREQRGEQPAPSLLERSLVHNLTLWLQRVTHPTPREADRRRGRIGDVDYWFLWDDYSFDGLDGEIDVLLASLAQTRAHVVKAGGRHAIVLIPSKLRVLGPSCTWPPDSEVADLQRELGPLPARLREWAATRSVPLLDLTEALTASTRAGSPTFLPRDTHWSATGHRVAAEAIAGWDVLRGWLR